MPSDASLPLAISGRTGIRRRSFVPRATDRAPDSDEGIVLKNRQPAEWSPHQSVWTARSEEHTSELQSLMRNSYAVVCLKNKKQTIQGPHQRKSRQLHIHRHDKAL